MKKKPTSNAWKRSTILLVSSLFALVSCSGSVPYWLTEEERIEFCAKVESMEANYDCVTFFAPKERYYDYPFTKLEHFYTFESKYDNGFHFSSKDTGSRRGESAMPGSTITAYDYGLKCLKGEGYKNYFSLIDILPFAKESAKKAKGVKGSLDYPGYWFDMDQSVYDSFKTFRDSYFNSRANKAIDEYGSLYFEVSDDFKSLSLFVGSIDDRFTDNPILKGMI